MVVVGLEKYMESKNWWHDANLIDLLREESAGEANPTIVLDSSSVGFHPDCHISDFEKFVDEIISSGVRVFVILRGNTTSLTSMRFKKIELKLKQEKKKWEEFIEFGKFHEGTPIPKVTQHNYCHHIFTSISGEGYKVFTSLDKTAEQVAEISKKYRCKAVIGQDSDYVIFEGIKHYISAKSLNLETFQCKVYDRKQLLNYFELTAQQLPLFASLVGNEITYDSWLKSYHKRIQKGDLFTSIAQRIKHTADPYSYLKEIAQDTQNPRAEAILRKSIDMYVNPNRGTAAKPELNFFDKMKISNKISRTLHSLITLKIFQSKRSQFGNFKTAEVLMRPLRQKLYGILFCDDSTFVEEYFVGLPHNLFKIPKPRRVYPMPPIVKHPGLISLWTINTPAIKNMRWMLFCTTVSTRAHNHAHQIPPKLLIPALAVRYLREAYGLSGLSYKWESFLLVALKMQDEIVAPEQSEIPKPTYELVQLIHNYSNCCYILELLNEACGCVISPKDSCQCNFFEEGLFFYIHDKLEKGTESSTFLEGTPNLEQTFDSLYKLAFNT